MRLKQKIGSSLLEALIAASLISLAALAYGNLQISSFARIIDNERMEKISTAMSDFSSKMLVNITNRELQAEKDQVTQYYLGLLWDTTKNSCANTPTYIQNCLNTDLGDLSICNLEKMASFDMYNFSCSTLEAAPNSIFSLNYCDGSLEQICVWVSVDGSVRDQTECKNSSTQCLLMEIKI